MSQPMTTCFVGGNVTLTCLVSHANPPARIQWLRNLTQPEATIQPSSRYVITQQDQSSSLTIHNCSQDLDGGFYFCRAENPVGVRAVDIWLSVKGRCSGWPQRLRAFRAPGTTEGAALGPPFLGLRGPWSTEDSISLACGLTKCLRK